MSQDVYYETNYDEILSRLKFGTYEAIATGWNDSIAEQIIHALLLHGQVLAGDLLDRIATQQEEGVTDQISTGATKPVENYRAMKVSSTLVRLLQDSYIRPSTAMQHVSRRDRELAHEAALRRSFKGIPTAKTLKEFKLKVAHLIDEEDSRESEAPDQATNDVRLGLKRKATTNPPQAKRSRKEYHVDGSAEPQDNSVMWDVDRSVWLRVNYDRFNVQIRNDMIVRAVSQKYNPTTGEVFRAALANDSPGTLRCELDDRSSPVSINTIVQSLPAGLKLQRGLDKRSLLDDRADSQPTAAELVADYIAILTGQDNISSSVQSTRFLAPFGTTTTTSASGAAKVPTSVTIEYGNILRSLQLQLVHDVVITRFGPMAGRIFKILLERGKLEEKHISKIGLLSMGETRDLCARMFAASLLSLQEVPKSNERNPQRTFFLWFVDFRKCKTWLSDHYCKTIGRLIQRRLFERSRKSLLLRKLERSDVKEDTDGLLTDWERESLAVLHTVLESLATVEVRVVLSNFLLDHFP
ncbi:RNA polymerase III subunit C82 [Malassezia psittaci]|uniref:DNA-directed RNA polymerase III subunit RPC3 n=1 Tax=Malassezia psittaci TaxID=1821823 RepID=A0AAF0F5G0_9BASI|nr:RNA polymerase III subunit C82 [Malassezia psittaci]